MKDICTICKISSSKYYGIVKRKKLDVEVKDEEKKVNVVKSYLKGKEIEYLKRLADNPRRSYSVPDMREAFEEKYKDNGIFRGNTKILI